jgi:hypothetical protein
MRISEHCEAPTKHPYKHFLLADTKLIQHPNGVIGNIAMCAQLHMPIAGGLTPNPFLGTGFFGSFPPKQRTTACDIDDCGLPTPRPRLRLQAVGISSRQEDDTHALQSMTHKNSTRIATREEWKWQRRYEMSPVP